MAEQVDARGLACPAPVVKTREALKKGARDIVVLVDNPTARDNVSRFASSQGCRVEVEEGEEGTFKVSIAAPLEMSETLPVAGGRESEKRSVVVIAEDSMGRGERELGEILIKAFLNTLAESDDLPWRIVLFNRGVMLAQEGADTTAALGRLCDLGVEVLVCGTCLDYFGIKDKVAVGTVSNMFDILSTMMASTNTVTV